MNELVELSERESMKLIKELSEKLVKRKRENLFWEKRSIAESMLMSKGIPKAFVEHIDFNCDFSIEAQVEKIEKLGEEVRKSLSSIVKNT